MEDYSIVFNNEFIKIIHSNNNTINKIIIPKKNIKKAVMRVRMRRKIKALLRTLALPKIYFFTSIIKNFNDFKIVEYLKIQKKIIKYVKSKENISL